MSTAGPAITSLELESRTFPPPRELAENAVAKEDLYAQAAADHDGFWLEQATGLIDWMTPPTTACDRSRAPFFTWFADGTLNASVNCLDRHLDTAGDRVAFFSEEPDHVFARSHAVIRRKVQNCHPPKSVDTVERSLRDFRDGSQSVAEFWIEFHGKFVHVRYFAVRDEEKQYLGTLEVTQDLTPLRALQGERRLLEYSSV